VLSVVLNQFLPGKRKNEEKNPQQAAVVEVAFPN
jgi:hypothetical protein